MKNVIRSTTQLAMLLVSQYLTPGQAAIDATCGNGNDTVALAKLGAGRIYAFDIQKKAIERTMDALVQEGLYSDKITLVQDGHEHMGMYIREKVQVILFNLGYLPGADKNITTNEGTTTKAVREALRFLKKDGLLCLTMYSGHPDGEAEKQALLEWAKSLDQREYHVAYINMLNQRNHPPEIMLVTLKRSVEFEED